MNDFYIQVLLLIRAVWLRRWYALAVSWLVALGGWTYVSTLPDEYASSAQIYIDTDTMLRPLLKGVTVQPDIGRQIKIMQQTLLSRPNMERVARMADMDLNARTDAQLEALVSGLQKNVSLRPMAANLFKLSYRDSNPQRAKRVVQAVVTVFVESNIGANRQDISQARRFIDEQLREYERQLTEAEQRRAQFRRENMGFLPGEGNYFSRMQAARGRLEDLKRGLHESELGRDEMRKQLKDVSKYIAIRSAGGAGSFAGADQVASLRRRLTELDMRGYTEQHPDVLAARRALENATAQYEVERAAIEKGGKGESPLTANATRLNPVWEQIQLRLVETETNIAKSKSRVKEQTAAVIGLDKMAKTVPGIEAELIRLDRDYSILKQKYTSLLGSRESARIAQDVEAKSDKVQFRVIEPPELPRRPSAPNRPALISISLLLGLGAGLGFAFLLSQVHNTFSTANALRSTIDLPVLGTITAVSFESYTKRRRVEIVSFAIVFSGLILAYLFVMIYRVGSALPGASG